MLNSLCLCWLVTVAKVIGFIYLIRAAITVLKHIRTAMVRLTPEWASKYGLGSWAVVTGCTEGIGKGFCYVLAPLRINLCLVSRNKAKLEALEAELKAKFSRLQTKIVVADFSESSPAFYDRVIAEIGDIDVSILVNNVGMAYLGPINEQTTQQIDYQVNLNVKSISHLTNRLLPRMLSRHYRSALVNLSSNSITCPFRLISVYTGCKAYDDLFSQCVAQDLKKYKIDIVSCRPNIVSTAGTNNSRDPTAVTAEACAAGTLKALGRLEVTEGAFYHVVQTWISNFIPAEVIRRFGQPVLSIMHRQKIAAEKKSQ